MSGRLSARARRPVSMLALVALVGGLMVAFAAPAGALQPPWSPTVKDWTREIAMVCRANAGALGGNQIANQNLDYTIQAPDGVAPGGNFDIVIKSGLSIFPRNQQTLNATVNVVRHGSWRYQMPLGVTINSVQFIDTPGSPPANPAGGYYVDRANVPVGLTQATPNMSYPEDWDPLVDLTQAQRIAIPGTPVSVAVDTQGTNVIKVKALGSGNSGSSGEYRGGSAVQVPWVKVNVTATAPAGTNLDTSVPGQTPNALPQGPNYSAAAGTQPQPSFTSDPTVSSNWPNSTFTTNANATILSIFNVDAPTVCAPGYANENGAIPDYMTGPDALPNGVAPYISRTKVVNIPDIDGPEITISSPLDNGGYVTGEVVSAAFDCNDYFGSGDDVCIAENDGNPILNGEPIETTNGTHTLKVTAIDNDGNESTLTHTYSVAGNQDPAADAGPNQTNRTAGQTVTLTAAGSTDPDGPPAQTLSYSWEQVPNGAPTVTLNNANTVSPTFTVAPVDSPAGHTYEFQVTVTDGHGGSDTDTVQVGSVPSTPTAAAPTRTRAGGGTTFFVGDVVTLSTTITNPDGNNPADYTYQWTQISGRTTSLNDPTSPNPTYVIPPSGANGGTQSACTSGSGATSPTQANCPRFSVVVTKVNTGAASAAANMANYSASLPARPVANAGPNQGRGVLRPVTLDGTASTQAQGHSLNYAWTQTGGDPVVLTGDDTATPSFTTPATVQDLTFQLVVTDATSALTTSGAANLNFSLPSTVTVKVTPDNVVADAGPDQAGKVAGNVVTLDASESTDPDGLPLEYTWQQLSGPPVLLSDIHAVNPTFTVPPATAATHDYTFTVTATNGGPDAADTDTDATPVTISQVAANVTIGTPTKSRVAGGTTFFVGDVVQLNPGAITNADGNDPDDYDYQWTQTTGRTTALSDSTVRNPTFIVPPRGDTGGGTTTACQNNSTGGPSPTHQGCPKYQVTVTHKLTGKSVTSAALANWSTPSLPARPTANAGANQNALPLDVVTLNGSGAQTQGHAISYEWTQTGGPTTVLLSDPTAAQPTFSAPAVAGAYTFALVVRDTQSALSTAAAANLNFSTTATTTVTVTLFPQPVADAGEDQTVLVSTPVQLDGSGSFDPNGHENNYTWTQLSGTPVELSDENAVSPTFTAPNEPTTLVFRLTTDDGPYGGSGMDDVTITVYNTAPEIDAGESQNVSKKDVVTLHGSASDADGHSLTYTWLQVSGTPVTLSDEHAAQPTFTAPDEPASLSFQLTVDDGHGGIVSDSTSVTVVVTPGLNLQASTEVNFKPETAKSTFKVAVTNVGSIKTPVSNAIVKGLLTVNGEPVPAGQVVMESKSTQLAAGKTVKFLVTWNHGTSLVQLGDDIAFTGCASALGDENPDNNCTTWNSLVPNLNASVASSLATVKKGSVKDTIKVSVGNTGLGRISPVRDTDVTLTVSYGTGSTQVTRTVLANPLVVGLNPGEARNFSFVWDHPKLPTGTQVTVQACINAPNNVSANACTSYVVEVV